MKRGTYGAKLFVLSALVILACHAVAQNTENASEAVAVPTDQPHNVIIFVTDGLRHDSVTPENAPTIYSLRQQGVDFVNSHSLYPTFTTPNASVFATGHQIGDTGDFGNTLYFGRPAPGKDCKAPATLTPFIENDSILAALNCLYGGNYVQEETLLDLARKNGHNIASVGKLGPVAIQDISEIQFSEADPDKKLFQPTSATVIDDTTGGEGIPLPWNIRAELKNSGLSASAPDRSNGQQDTSLRGHNGRSGTLAANINQQQYFTNAVTQAILPAFKKDLRPFLLVVWSRDPDGTQHNQGDSLDQLVPGINGPTSRAAIRNADNNLWQIVDYLKATDLDANTDIIVVADHGFSTISKKEVARTGTVTKSYAGSKVYLDVKEGYLPAGFLAIDLAHALKKSLYDPDAPPFTSEGRRYYQRLNICGCDDSKFMQHPVQGNGVIGGGGKLPEALLEPMDAEIIVAANGGSDLIYLPQSPDNSESNQKLALEISNFLLQQDYVDGIFVRDDLGEVPGTLRLSDIGLIGGTMLPKPAIIVNFKSFSLTQGSLLSRIEIADSTLQEGQGMHGTFSRADTYNAMVAFGPDFKSGYIDRAPVSNADISVTIAHLMKWNISHKPGDLPTGRVLAEAIKGGPDMLNSAQATPKVSAQPGAGGLKTQLQYQILKDEAGEHRYYDQACFVNSTADKQDCK
jgi:hypothetical protein